MSETDRPMERRQGEKTSVQNNKILWWLMGIVAVVLTALAGSWANGIYGAVDNVAHGVTETNRSLEENTKELRAIVQQQAERLVRVETYNEVQRQEMSSMRQQLTRVETKVDELGKK